MVQALEDIKAAGGNALCVYPGNFDSEVSETLLAKHFDAPAMFVAAAEETQNDLVGGCGDVYCGILNASYNLKVRNIKAYIPEMGRFYRHALLEKNYPHNGAVAFGHFGKALYEVFQYIGVPVEDRNFNQPKGMMYPSENPFA